jgi:3-hydroxyacyl-CoA dehydrogenase / enoyl-CoA hydratase / 3-hydroxybutyryl-CoA epimerase
VNAGLVGSDTDPAFTVDQRTDGVVVLRMDGPHGDVNLLTTAYGQALERLLEALERKSDVKAVVLTSAKQGSFLVGPDVTVLEELRTINDGIDCSRAGQALTDHVAGLRVPVVAAIHGACLGSGLELVLACHGRVASRDPTTVLGLPEVELGLLPAMGGTQRLPRLVGCEVALDLILSGQRVGAERAQALGLVDTAAAPDRLLDAAVARALELCRAGPGAEASRGRRVRALIERALSVDGNPVVRRVLFARVRREVAEGTRGNYPAPERVVQAVEAAADRDQRRGFWAESRAFGELATSHQAAQLVYLHRASMELRDEATKLVAVGARGALSRVGVLGSSTLAEQLSALTVAQARLAVVLEGRGSGRVGNARGAVERELSESMARGSMTRAERDAALARVSEASGLAGFPDCELVIEAVAEDLGLKRQLLLGFEDQGRSAAMFVTTTVAWAVGCVAEVSRTPERVVGLHYAEPLGESALLEVVAHEHTCPAAVAACIELGQRQGKTVLVVRDGPGGYTPRLTASLLVEGLHLLDEGVSAEALEEALRDWGFAGGSRGLFEPRALERWARVATVLAESLGARLRPPELLGRLARAARRGNEAGEPPSTQARAERRVREVWSAMLGTATRAQLRASEIAQRCALRLVDEAARCYEAGLVTGARDGDVGAVRGVGFPAFRGGPFRYVDEVGAGEVVRRLERLARERGARFTPAPLLVRMARGEGSFHGPRALPPGTERTTR